MLDLGFQFLTDEFLKRIVGVDVSTYGYKIAKCLSVDVQLFNHISAGDTNHVAVAGPGGGGLLCGGDGGSVATNSQSKKLIENYRIWNSKIYNLNFKIEKEKYEQAREQAHKIYQKIVDAIKELEDVKVGVKNDIY